MWLKKISASDRHDELYVTDAKPVLNYILSAPHLHGERYSNADRHAELLAFLDSEITQTCRDQGAYRIRCHSVLLEFKRPV